MKISELSEKTGVSQRMLRYFEELGLLCPRRTDADYRDYADEDCRKILDIREWQRLGLTLKEISEIFSRPQDAGSLLQAVFVRERDAFIEKQKSLRDLRERFSGQKNHGFGERVAYPIPNADRVVADLETHGWSCADLTYIRFAEWREHARHRFVLMGEMIWQSAFYLLAARDPNRELLLHRFMAEFCRAAQRQWPKFDGHPPMKIDAKDIGDFSAPAISSSRYRSPRKRGNIWSCFCRIKPFSVWRKRRPSNRKESDQ